MKVLFFCSRKRGHFDSGCSLAVSLCLFPYSRWLSKHFVIKSLDIKAHIETLEFAEVTS